MRHVWYNMLIKSYMAVVKIAKKKEPAKVWIDGDLIKILPFKTDEIYFLDYTKENYNAVKNVRWTDWGRGYPMGWVNKNNVLLHHVILPAKKGYVVDHINRDIRDNRKENLRYVNRHQSGINRSKQKSNTSGYVGVYFHKQRKTWNAQMRVNGKSKHLGAFKTPEKAKKAYDEALEKYYPNILYKH